MVDELIDYKHLDKARRKIDIIDQIEINCKANKCLEPNHPTFPALELLCKIHDINVYFSDYIFANLKNIQNAMSPPPKEEEEIKLEKKKSLSSNNSLRKASKIEEIMKKAYSLHRKKIRNFEESDEEQNNNDFDEGTENVEEEDTNVCEVKQMQVKSKKDMEAKIESFRNDQLGKIKQTKVDQRILIFFDKMKITIGEVVRQEKLNLAKYSAIIDTHVSEIPHINFAEMMIEGLELEYNSGSVQKLYMIMTRLYIKDLQKIQVIQNNKSVVKSLIPECYQMILSNPDIEKEICDDTSSHYSMNTKSFRTDDFLSIKDFNNQSSENSEDQTTNNLSQLKLSMIMHGQTSNVDFLFSNMRLIFAPSTLLRLSKFNEKIQTLQKENEQEDIKLKLETVSKILKEEEQFEPDSKDENHFNSMRKKAQKLIESANEAERAQLSKSSKGYIEKYQEQRNKYLMKGKKTKFKEIEQIAKMNAKGKLENFEIWIPLDSMDEYSRVFSLSFSNQISYKSTSLTSYKINEITSQIVETQIIKNQTDANVLLNNMMMSMVNRHLLSVQEELTTEKLLLPSRISIVYDNLNNVPKEINITNTEMTIEPFDMKVGFRELEDFKVIQKIWYDFQAKMYKKGGEQKEYEGKIESDESKSEKELINQIDSNQISKPKKSIKNRKVKQIIKMNVKLISESINLSIMDDTRIYEYPLINFNISKIVANMTQETGEDDAASFILKKMGISVHPFYRVEAGLILESNYFNAETGSYEPIIEPFSCNAMILQKTVWSAKEYFIKSDEMLNLNVTYGMALALKLINKRMSQKKEDWEDEMKIEETKAITKKLSSMKSAIKKNTSKQKSLRDGEEDEEVEGFYFENHLGIGLKIALENHDLWINEKIQLTEEQEDSSVIYFQEWEEQGERNFRSHRELSAVNKFVKKEQNGGKFLDNSEDNILRCDIYIDGFEPVTGVPIEISGIRSYELKLKGETKEQTKKNKHLLSFIVNVSTEGIRKLVTFQSQLLFSNHTEFNIEIAQVFTQIDINNHTELSKSEIELYLKAMMLQKKQESENNSLAYNDILLFNSITINKDFKAPLLWFIDDVCIYYKCQNGKFVNYQMLLPNLKSLLCNKDKRDNKYENLEKYYMLTHENIDNIFFAMDIEVIKARPTALDRPPQFNCVIKPPICLNNKTFADISIFRVKDDKLMRIVQPGSYTYLYEGVKKKREDNPEESEEEKEGLFKNNKSNKKLDETPVADIKLNKYIFRFEDDGNVLYESNPDYFYCSSYDYKFLAIDNDFEDCSNEKPIVLKYEVIKFNTFMYTPYIIINKTDFALTFGEKGERNDLTRFIPANQNEYFNPQSNKKKKFSIVTDNYDWAEPFDITTLGMAGQTTLERLSEYDQLDTVISKYVSNKLNLGVLISNLGGIYGKTTTIKIVPRYMIVNNSKSPIVLAQDNDNSAKQYWIPSGSSTIYHFENKKDKNNFVKIRLPDEESENELKIISYEDIGVTDWSSRFSIDDFEDFQISVQSKIESQDDEESKETVQDNEENENINAIFDLNNKNKWHEPSKLTNYRKFIRVIVTTQDEATMFVMICDPNMPEYRINNKTGKKIIVYQKDAKDRTIAQTCPRAMFVKERGKIIDILSYPVPFVWNDQAATDKRIIIEIAGERKEYDLDEIEDK